ncbi:polysaccharide biosynthesis/export family protein [Maridesulfovibrio salexigens]|uniref:Polysaccharide export protein n=1 Tax=Maridesulfovibrio salexigens (strain ATCC 14822 / DSM 2638 / NCIMB 8403 / VKM B-1763) TaxID=526222 RepID=C6BXH6_MARSD|nr:polysaccharide biosynthesis/export family protein [Maridesulfovibrio salexigens]ACS80482.1 polysaccharide export protein [Maridesulfovibrio salexigens DSM 2638]
MNTLKLFALFFFVIFFAISPGGASAQLTVNDEYRLGPEDIIEISVWGDKELSREVVVRPDGGVSFPLAGDLKAGGLTVKELRDKLKERISEFVPDAPVTVILRKVEHPKVYVMGKVNNPKVLVMGQSMTVVQALAMSGGLSPFAESGSIIIVRKNKDGSQKVFPFDYDQLADGENLKQNILLKPGDTIIVP